MDFNGFQCRLCVEMVFETRLEGKKATDHGEEDHAAAPEVAHLRHVASQLSKKIRRQKDAKRKEKAEKDPKKIRNPFEIERNSSESDENFMRILERNGCPALSRDHLWRRVA